MGGTAEVDSEAVTQIAAPQSKGRPGRNYVLSWRPRLPAPPCAPPRSLGGQEARLGPTGAAQLLSATPKTDAPSSTGIGPQRG